MRHLVGMIALLLLLAGCNKKQTTQDESSAIQEIASSDDQWTGITISEKGRMFVNFPRWSPDIKMSVAEITEDGKILPFPNEKWNSWKSDKEHPENYFVCVQSVVVDDNNNLWVLDTGNPLFKGVIPYAPKLVKIDLKTGNIADKVVFGFDVLKDNSYLNDLRINTETKHIYITDSNDGAIVVFNYENGNVRRLLDDHFSTEPELPLVINGSPWKNSEGDLNFVASDGIALDSKNKYLYYHALTGLSLYRIETKYLEDTSVSQYSIKNHVEFVARTGASDGLIAGPEDGIYHSNVEENAIIRYNQDGTIDTIAQDHRIKWPDTFTFGKNGDLYFTTSQIHISDPEQPYKIFKIHPN